MTDFRPAFSFVYYLVFQLDLFGHLCFSFPRILFEEGSLSSFSQPNFRLLWAFEFEYIFLNMCMYRFMSFITSLCLFWFIFNVVALP